MRATSGLDCIFLMAALCVLVAVILTSCCGLPGEHPETAASRSCEYGSLTGSTATQGSSTQKGIDMARDRANNSGGVLGRKIEVIVEDDRGKPEEAQTAVTRLITKYGVS